MVTYLRCVNEASYAASDVRHVAALLIAIADSGSGVPLETVGYLGFLLQEHAALLDDFFASTSTTPA
jgi:hypothetical protein